MVVAGIAGIFCGNLCGHSPEFRARVCRALERGQLVAVAGDAAISDQDITRRREENGFRKGEDAGNEDATRVRNELIAMALAHRQARPAISAREVDREKQRLIAQGQAVNLSPALLLNRSLYGWSLKHLAVANRQTLDWLDREVGSAPVSDQECRQFYRNHPADFAQPARYRVSHLFLAAPEGTDEQMVETKKHTMEELSSRIREGTDLAALTAMFSEDEATRRSGGDLNWFSNARMPDDFLSAVMALRVAETSGVVQTHLGFHLIKVTGLKPAAAMDFAAARSEIEIRLANDRRTAVISRLVSRFQEKAKAVFLFSGSSGN